MRKFSIVMAIVATVFIGISCTRVEPNYIGVLMENYGKAGKSDYSIVSGKVSTFGAGTELYQCPLWEQRADFGDRLLHLKAGDNTEFTSKPVYSYRVIKDKAIDVVFNNSHLGSGESFMRALEDNVLEAKIYDIMKEESRKYITDSLMAIGGSLKFEERIQVIVSKVFSENGLGLTTLSCQLDFSDKVKAKIDNRNEVNTNISVLDQQILEQKKRNELEELKTQQNIIRSRGLTPQILQLEFLDAWRETKTPIYGNIPFVKTIQ